MKASIGFFFVLNLLLSGALFLATETARADDFRPAYLRLIEVQPDVYEVFWKTPIRYEAAPIDVAFTQAPALIDREQVVVSDGMQLTTYKARFVDGIDGNRIDIVSAAPLNTEVLLQIIRLNGKSVTHRFSGENNSLIVDSNTNVLTVAWTYVGLGVEHILIGYDHLLFVLGLMLLVTSLRSLLITITLFTVSHSITLSLAALDLVKLPVPPIEACIALSIVFVAAEIIRAERGESGFGVRAPFIMAFSFGLLHGLGFAAVVSEIGLPRDSILVALFCFNIGVEIGQLLFIAGLLVIVTCFKRVQPEIKQKVTRTLPYIIGSVASFWFFERLASFTFYS